MGLTTFNPMCLNNAFVRWAIMDVFAPNDEVVNRANIFARVYNDLCSAILGMVCICVGEREHRHHGAVTMVGWIAFALGR